MVDPEARVEHLGDLEALEVAVVVLGDENVRGEGRKARGDHPDVEVVDLDHAGDGGHLAADL